MIAKMSSFTYHACFTTYYSCFVFVYLIKVVLGVIVRITGFGLYWNTVGVLRLKPVVMPTPKNAAAPAL
jgi:hypothetical protein